MPQGGKRAGAGRPKGRLNKVTEDVKIAAQAFTTDALETLAWIMRASESDAARVAAANSILDRGHGKPKQSIDVDANVTTFDVASDPEPSEAEWSAQHAR